MAALELKKDRRVAARCNDPPGSGFGGQPEFFQMVRTVEKSDTVLPVQDKVRDAVLAENGSRASEFLQSRTGLTTAVAAALGSDNARLLHFQPDIAARTAE